MKTYWTYKYRVSMLLGITRVAAAILRVRINVKDVAPLDTPTRYRSRNAWRNWDIEEMRQELATWLATWPGDADKDVEPVTNVSPPASVQCPLCGVQCANANEVATTHRCKLEDYRKMDTEFVTKRDAKPLEAQKEE